MCDGFKCAHKGELHLRDRLTWWHINKVESYYKQVHEKYHKQHIHAQMNRTITRSRCLTVAAYAMRCTGRHNHSNGGRQWDFLVSQKEAVGERDKKQTDEGDGNQWWTAEQEEEKCQQFANNWNPIQMLLPREKEWVNARETDRGQKAEVPAWIY